MGVAEFMGLKFKVTKDTLIPQPDTEILVEETLKVIKPKDKVLDMCTGSGAIAVSIAKYKNNIKVVASDISKKALDVAISNAKFNNADITFIESDMFQNISQKFDVIVSNPPYIKTKVINALPKEVQKEPYIALDGGEDGLKFYKIFAKQAHNFLNENGMLFLEIGYDEAESVVALLKNTNKYKKIYVKKDLNKIDRVIIAQK